MERISTRDVSPEPADHDRRSRALVDIGRALQRLRTAATVDDLIERIPQETVRLGD